jgi:hypothetical protein
VIKFYTIKIPKNFLLVSGAHSSRAARINPKAPPPSEGFIFEIYKENNFSKCFFFLHGSFFL